MTATPAAVIAMVPAQRKATAKVGELLMLIAKCLPKQAAGNSRR